MTTISVARSKRIGTAKRISLGEARRPHRRDSARAFVLGFFRRHEADDGLAVLRRGSRYFVTTHGAPAGELTEHAASEILTALAPAMVTAWGGDFCRRAALASVRRRARTDPSARRVLAIHERRTEA